MAPRTRACRPCRDRRCKCDEMFPQCMQCLKTNRVCPGPVQGLVVVDMTATTTQRNQQGYRTFQRSHAFCKNSTTASLVSAPSQSPAMSEQLFSHFVDFFCGKNVGVRRDSWMYRLPSAHLTAGSPLTIRLSMQAAAVGFYAVRSKSTQALRCAREFYGRALNTHRASLVTLQTSQHTEALVAVEALCTTLMLSFFETLHCTNPTAYAEHLIGATRVVEMVGPDQCSSGLLNQLYFSLRSQIAFVSIFARRASVFACQEWLDVPWAGLTERPIHERVVDILVLLPEFLAILDHYEHDSKARLIGPATDLLSRLDSLWHEYKSEAELRSREHFRGGGHQKGVYADAVTAMTACQLDCARIVLMSVLAIIVPRDDHDYSSEITSASESVLACVAFMDTHDIGCAYLRMMLPLSLVSTSSPSAHQRSVAHSTLQKWHSENMMTGVAMIAMYTIGTTSGNNGEGREQKDQVRLNV